ncbi:MAG: glycosyltransferase [Oscillospiraceae bacterium]|nr:glycosyltransferase [Oscillospiraceae bacterium]
MENYSVLMSVYMEEDPEYFAAAIQSMLDQTVVTDDFVIVCDGPLTAELDGALEGFVSRYPGLFQIVRLRENVGVGLAAKAGLAVCRNDLIAKMDSDDISTPDRCEKQLAQFATEPELTLLGGVIEEFDNRTGKVCSVRCVPVDHEGICRYARRRSPINNVTAMYRKSAALDSGGYRDLRRGEDYDLYLRMLIRGCRARNLPDTLVRVRVDTDAHRRRTSWSAMGCCARIWWHAWRAGFSSLGDLVICLTGELFLVICPGRLQQALYKRFLRKQI